MDAEQARREAEKAFEEAMPKPTPADDGGGRVTADAVLHMATEAKSVDAKVRVLHAFRSLSREEQSLLGKQVAKALGMTVAELRALKGKGAESDEIVKGHVPHPVAVDGSQMADDIEAMFARHLHLPPHGAVALTLWSLVTHAVRLDAFEIAPYLNLTSPVRRCGKSTTVDLLEAVVAYPLTCSGVSAATLFRIIEAARPTVLIDEADKVFAKAKDNPDLIGAINAGHRQGGTILRCVGDEHNVKPFRCFAAYALAGIGALPDTIADRSIPIPLSRRPPGITLERRGAGWRANAWAKGERAARWTADNLERLSELAMHAPRPSFLDDRAADTWAPLFAVAKALGGDWLRKAWEAARALSGRRDVSDDSSAARILRDCRTAFDSDWNGDPREVPNDRLATSELLRRLNSLPESPWKGWNRGTGITDRGLSKLLRPYGVAPKTIRLGTETLRGYERTAFEAAWDAYLGADPETDGDADEWKRWAASAECDHSTSDPGSDRNSATTADFSAKPCCADVPDADSSATPNHCDSSDCGTLADEEAVATTPLDDEGVTI